MENEIKPNKGVVGKILNGIFNNPLSRGIIKSLPFGNVAYEIGENISNSKDENSKSHSAISLAAQIIFLGLIVYAFFTKQITIEDVLNYVGIEDFENTIKK